MLDGYELVPEAYGQKFQNCGEKKINLGCFFINVVKLAKSRILQS